MSALAVLDGSLRKIHAMVSPFMLEEMVFACEAVVALAGTVLHVAVN